MTEPKDAELLELAIPYALYAVSDFEVAAIERRVANADAPVADAFRNDVRSIRETMAVMSASTAAEPPAELRGRLLAAVTAAPTPRAAPARSNRWRNAMLAAAAAVVVGLTAVGVGMALRPGAAAPTTAEQVFAAPDVRTVSGAIPTGGTATVVFSREKDAGVLVMNGVAPPSAGTVYQMWLVDDANAISAGTMDAAVVQPSTTAVLPDLGDSQVLAFTVEPGGGSVQPTGEIFAQLPLI